MKWFQRLPRREVLIVAALTLAAFVTTLAVLESRAGSRARRQAADQRQELARTQKTPALSAEELALTQDDFLVPEMQIIDTAPRYEPFRPRLTRWSPQIVEKYWIAPRDIAVEILGSVNDSDIRHLFEAVP